ncbi:translation initiation factor IF-2-like [Cervus elaphus]|uniref:translation initiation factor IF-2-like n=1 Tax=Cervus elaphus TaxID=9860 RepID=UPI001CC285D0|nr:translation initiation factor IF-2-like [Cervus elaphus]
MSTVGICRPAFCRTLSPSSVSSPSPPATANGYSAASLGLHGACPRCGTQPRAGGGKGWGARRASAHPGPRPGPQPARRRAEPPLTGPRCRRPGRPAPRSRPLPPHPRQAPPRRYRDGEHKGPGHTPDPSPWKKNFAAHASRHAHARRAPGRASLTCPRAATHRPPHPPTHGGLAAPRPEVGPPAARSERLHSLPGCARPAPAGPGGGGGGGGGDRDSGCSGGGGGGPSRRQSDWSREASSPVLVRRPGKPPGALLAGPPPPAAARPEPLGEPARRGSAARPAATCAEARGGGASGTPRRGVSRPPGRRPRPPVRPDSPRPRLDPLGRAAGAPRRIPGDVLPPHLEPEAGGPFPELEVWDRQIGLETAAPTKWLFPTCFWAPRVAVPCCLSLTCFARVKGVITPSRQRQSNWFAPAQADENRLTQSAQFWRSKIKVSADSDRLRPLDQQDAWLEDASFSLVFISR